MTLPEKHKQPLANLLLALADDKLMLGHRNSDWTGLGPILEEDIAFSSLAQDEIAHAQAIYEFVGKLLNNDVNELAFGRTPEQYKCAAIVEPHDEFNWAMAIVRQFFCDHFDRLRLSRLANSSWKPLADMTKRLAAEEAVHVEHADSWIRRLGRGTDESRNRIQHALDSLSPLTASLFEPTEGQDELEKDGLYPPADEPMHDAWQREIRAIITNAELTITLPEADASREGGRRGKHSDAFHELLDEMCEVYRIEPGAAW